MNGRCSWDWLVAVEFPCLSQEFQKPFGSPCVGGKVLRIFGSKEGMRSTVFERPVVRELRFIDIFVSLSVTSTSVGLCSRQCTPFNGCSHVYVDAYFIDEIWSYKTFSGIWSENIFEQIPSNVRISVNQYTEQTEHVHWNLIFSEKLPFSSKI